MKNATREWRFLLPLDSYLDCVSTTSPRWMSSNAVVMIPVAVVGVVLSTINSPTPRQGVLLPPEGLVCFGFFCESSE